MRKETSTAVVLFVAFVGLLALRNPLEALLMELEVEALESWFISGILVRTTLLTGIVLVMRKLGLLCFAGFGQKLEFRNLHAAYIALAFVAIGMISNQGIYLSTEPYLLFLFASSVLLVGFFEEFLFRGSIFPLFLRALKNNQHVLIIGALLSSVLFGAVHYINLFSQPENFGGITSQVFFAFSIGVFFAGLLLRTRNILLPAILHALINFAFGAGDLSREVTTSTAEAGEKDWGSLMITALVFSFIMIGGLYMILKTSKEEVLERLGPAEKAEEAETSFYSAPHRK